MAAPVSIIPETFTRFMDLPPELRIIIWTFVVENYPPSFVQICPIEDHSSRCMNFDPPGTYHVRTPRYEPTALSFKEARPIVLLRYQLAFGPVNGHKVYFNFMRDSLYLCATSRFWIIHYTHLLEQLAQVRNLVIYTPGISPGFYISQIAPFLRLEHLRILLPAARGRIIMQTLIKNQFATYWINSMNPRQVANGVPVTGPPALEFLTDADTTAFEMELNSLPAPPS